MRVQPSPGYFPNNSYTPTSKPLQAVSTPKAETKLGGSSGLREVQAPLTISPSNNSQKLIEFKTSEASKSFETRRENRFESLRTGGEAERSLSIDEIREREQREQKEREEYYKKRDLELSPAKTEAVTPVINVELANHVQILNEKNKKISELEMKVNQSNNQFENAQFEIKRLGREMENLKSNHKNTLEIATANAQRVTKELDHQRKEAEKQRREYEDKIRKLNSSIEEVNQKNVRQAREIDSLKSEIEKKGNASKLQEEVFTDFKKKMDEKTERINELERAIDKLTDEKRSLSRRIQEFDDERRSLQANLAYSASAAAGKTSSGTANAFDEALRQNLQDIQMFKDKLTAKDEEIFRWEEVNRTLKSENDRMRNEIEIEKLKRMTEIKNLDTNSTIELQSKTNEIQSLNHVIGSLEDKLKFIIQEDRRKDEFIVNHLKGRTKVSEEKDQIDEFFRQFSDLGINHKIADCLKREQQEIEYLRKEIRKLGGYA